MFRFLAGFAVTATVGLALLTSLPRNVAPAYACSGAWPPLDSVAIEAQAIAVVRAIEVGGPDYTIPPYSGPLMLPLTPTPTLAAAVPTATPRTRPQNFDLTGYGARLAVETVLLGSLPAEIEVDSNVRLAIEEDLRRRETAGFIFPCPPAFLTPHYEQGKRYLLFLRFQDGAWVNTPPMFEVDANNQVRIEWLELSVLVFEAFLKDYVLEEPSYITDNGLPFPPDAPRVYARSLAAPLPVFAQALQLARGEIEPPAPPQTPRPAPAVSITPPNIGNAGLR